MARLVGTAGHVDHGKTTLVRALTGIDADRLPEEQRRGMTIDIGFAYLDLPEVGRVSIVDVPGHEKFLSNMLVGAMGMEAALLCVAADEGVMPQTREHFQILCLLPVQRLIVALTRADLADEVTRELAADEVRTLLHGTRFIDAPVLAVSAQSGEGLKTFKAALQTALTSPTTVAGREWYLPIDRSFTVKGFGSVVTGTLGGGSVVLGDTAIVQPGGQPVRVRTIHIHDEPQTRSEPGQRTALNLAGIDLGQLERGQIVGTVGVVFETEMLDATVRWVAEPKHGERIRLAIGADEAIGRIFLNDHQADLVQVRLERPVGCVLNQPVILRRYSPPELLGGGRVVIPQAKFRRKKDNVRVADAKNLVDAVLQAVGDEPNGVPNEEVCRRLGKSAQALGDAFETLKSQQKILGFAGLWFTPAGFEAGIAQYTEALTKLHDEQPGKTGLPREKVASVAGLSWAGKPLDRILAELSSRGLISVDGTTVRSVQYKPKLPARQRIFLDRVLAEIEKADVNVPSPYDLMKTLDAPPQAIAEILRVGVQAGELVIVDEGIYYTPAQLEGLGKRIREFASEKSFSAAAVRDALGASRKYVIPLLEHFDSIRFTMRVGEERVIRD